MPSLSPGLPIALKLQWVMGRVGGDSRRFILRAHSPVILSEAKNLGFLIRGVKAGGSGGENLQLALDFATVTDVMDRDLQAWVSTS